MKLDFDKARKANQERAEKEIAKREVAQSGRIASRVTEKEREQLIKDLQSKTKRELELFPSNARKVGLEAETRWVERTNKGLFRKSTEERKVYKIYPFLMSVTGDSFYMATGAPAKKVTIETAAAALVTGALGKTLYQGGDPKKVLEGVFQNALAGNDEKNR